MMAMHRLTVACCNHSTGLNPSLTSDLDDDTPSFNALCFATRLGLLVAGGEHDSIMYRQTHTHTMRRCARDSPLSFAHHRCFNHSTGVLEQSYQAGLTKGEAIACIGSSKRNDLMASGTSLGYVTVR